MFNKVQKKFKTEQGKLKSSQIEKQILEILQRNGGYTQEQQIKLIDLQSEFRDKLESLKVEILTKNLDILK